MQSRGCMEKRAFVAERKDKAYFSAIVEQFKAYMKAMIDYYDDTLA